MIQDGTIENMKKIVAVLPKENCGKCGHENCGKYAKAIAEGIASPFECKKDHSVGYRISEILGMKVPQQAIIASHAKRTHDHPPRHNHHLGHYRGHHSHHW